MAIVPTLEWKEKMAADCSVCGNVPWKYKTPCCLTKYCSVACYKKHKETGCTQQQKQEKKPDCPIEKTLEENEESSSEYEFVTEDTVPKEKLKLLSEDSKLKDMLANPHLQNMLRDLQASTNPSEDMERAMKIPIFVEFADQCLRIVDPSKESEEGC